MAFDVQAARNAGYTDDEIADFLGTQSKFDVAGARKAGYTAPEIVGFLSQAANDAKPDQGLTPLDTEQVTSARPWQGAGAGRGSPNDPRRVDVEQPKKASGGIGAELGQLRDEAFMGVQQSGAAVSNINAFAQANRLANTEQLIRDLETRGRGDSAAASRLRAEAESLRERLPATVGTAAEANADTQRASQMTMRPAIKKVSEAKTFGDAWEAFKEAPYDVIAGVTAQSLPQVLPGLIAAAVTGPAAGAAAMGLNSGVVEFGSSLTDFAQDKGIDTRNAKAVQSFYADPANLSDALKYAGTRAGIIGTMDAASGGIAGKTLAPAMRSPIKRQAVNMPAQMAVQGAAGGGGEAAAQLATKGEIDQPGQVFLEVAGELGGAPAEVAAFTREAAGSPQDRAARALAADLESGQLPVAQVETLNPNLAIQRKTQEGLINIGAAQTVDDAIAAAANATAPTPQSKAVDNIAGLLGARLDDSTPGILPPNDSGAAGLGGSEPGVSLAPGVGSSGPDGRTLDAGSAGNQPDGGTAPLADRGAAPALSPDIADTASRIRELEGSTSTPEPGRMQSPNEPASMWFGRRGDGYQTPEDASAALPSRQRVSPDLEWKVEQMPSGRYRLAGYDPQSRQPAPTFAQNQAPGLINAAQPAIESVANDQNQPTREDTQAQAPAVEAPAPAGSDAPGAAVPAPAGPAQVEGGGVAQSEPTSENQPSLEDLNSGKAFVDSTKAKIAKWVASATNNGTRAMDRRWEREAVKRFIDDAIKPMLVGKQTGNRAAAKIAIGKAQTFDELAVAVEKFGPPALTNPPTQAQAGTPAEGAGESRPAPVAAPEPTAEQKIRQAFDAAPRTIGNWHKLTVEHNGKTQEFLANMKRVNTSGKRDSAIHLVNIRPGRLMAGDPLQDLAYYYKLDGKNNLVEEGIPSIATPEQLKAFGRPDPRLIPVSQRKQADGFENLLSLKSTKLILDDGRGRKLYDVQVTPAFRNRHFVNGRMPVVNGLELKHKADVTGVPSDNGWVLIDNREQLASRDVPKNQANPNTSAEPAQKTPESQQVGANDLTPKQYHDARLREMSDDTGTPLAEVREFYDTDGGRAESDRLWSVMVDKRARDGATLTRQTLDKFYELNPTARLPETAFPNGYQRPDARKQEAIAKEAIRQDRREAKAARAASEEQTGPYGRDLTPIAQGGKPFKTLEEAKDFRKKNTNNMVVKKVGKNQYVLQDASPKQIAAWAKADKRLGIPQTGGEGPQHAHGFLIGKGGLSKTLMADAGFDRNKRFGNRTLFADDGMTAERATELLVEAGYLREGASHNDMFNLVRKSVQTPQYTSDGWEQLAQAEQSTRFEDHLAVEQEAAIEEDPFGPVEAFTPAEIAVVPKNIREEYAALMEAAEAAGVDVDAILEEAARITENQTQEQFNEYVRQALTDAIANSRREADRRESAVQGREDAQRGGTEGSSQDAGRPGAQEEGLTAPTPEDIIARQERASRAAELDEQARLAREAQEANTPERQDKNLIAAVKLLVEYAGDTGNIYALAGRSGVDARVKVMAALQGVPRVPQAQAGVTALQDEFYRRAGVDPNQTSRRQELQFQAFVARVMDGDTGPALTAPTPAQVLEQQDRADRAEELDQREQIQREAAGQTLTQQTAPEQRKDNTGDMFGGPTVEDAERVREEKRKAEAEAKAKKDAESGQAPMFSRAAKEDPRDLIIQHNLTADNLLFAARMGGLPVPSLAITKAEAPMKNFGEITLLGDVNMADPRQGIKAYGADIYSPRYPRVTYQFTPNMRARAEKQVKAGLDATNTYIDWSEVERDGADELNRQPALMWEFLTSKGITPTIVRVEPKPLDPAIQPFANDTRNSFELAQDPAFQAAAWTAHQEMLTQAYGDAKEAQAEIEKMQQTARERGRSQVVNGYANGLDQYRRDKAVAGRVDTSATKRAMDAQIHDAGLTDEFRARNRQLMRDLAPNERMFQGYTYSGKRRYKPHTLDNVIAILKKELRGGENFNYGAGSLRAKFTPQFKSVAQIRANKDRLVSNAQFEAIKEEANNDLQMIAESLNKPTDTAIAIMEDAARMGLARAAAQYDVDLSDSQREMIGEYMTRLRNMPTEYFEGKLLRAVGIGEFKAAVVPENVSDDVLKLLDREGVTVFRYTKTSDGSDRARAIQQAANEIPDLMFSRTPAWRSELRDQIAAIKMESSKPEGWRAYIGGLTSKGVKPDEIEWSGITDWLKLQTGKVTKQQVLDYLDANGVQVQEVVLGQDLKQRLAAMSNDALAKDYEAITGDTPQAIYGDDWISQRQQVIADLSDSIETGGGSWMEGETQSTRYSKYTLPGGENYREVLLTLPAPVNMARREAIFKEYQPRIDALYARIDAEKDRMAAQNLMADLADLQNERNEKAAREAGEVDRTLYKSKHWDTPNVLAHIRLNDRVDSEGRRVLFVEEAQSDWGQEGKKKGFAAPGKGWEAKRDESGRWDVYNDGQYQATVDAGSEDGAISMMLGQRTGIPTAPFVTSTDKWLSLALKRIITMAAQEGYDRVAFVNGEQSADRYDLSKQVDRLVYRRADEHLIATDKDSRKVIDQKVAVDALPDMIGKEAADRLLNARVRTVGAGILAYQAHVLEGIELKVGGEGMRAFYDKILPNTLKDVLKKVGGGSLETVSFGAGDKGGWKAITSSGQEVTFNTEEEANQWLDQHGEDGEVEQVEGGAATQPGFTITPEMREKAANGLPMFRPGSEAAGMPLAKAQAIVDDLTKKWKNGPPVAVVASPSDLPMNAPDDARGVYWKGKVWIVAGPHKDRADIARTLSHEAVAHYGLRNILSADEWRQYMRNIQLAIKSGNKALTKIRDQVRSAYVDGDGKLYLTEQQEADEIAAKVVEQAIGPDGDFRPGFGFVKSVYARIMQFLRELGLDVKLTLAEVQGMLVLAQKNLEAGKRTVGQGDAVVAAGRGDQRPMDMRLDESRMGAFAGDPSPEEALSVQSAIEGKTAIEAADFIAQTAPEKQMRVIASRVADQMRKLEDAGMNFTLNVAHLGDQTHSQMAGKMRGMTWRAFGSSNVDVFVQGADVTGLVGTSYETVLHELLHAVTQSAIYAGQQAGNTALNKDVQDLQLVHDAIIRHFNQSIAGKTVGELDNYIERIVARGHNALREMDEVVSWGLTNKAMQDYLESIPYKNTTLWGEFVSAIRKFLGLPESAQTVLSEVLRITDRLLDAPVAQLTSLEMPTQTNYSGGLLNGARTGKDQTDTPAFKAWFGDSVVTDTGKAGGRPLVVYHGTKAEFDAFKRTSMGEFGPAIYLTDSPREAGEYGDGKGWGGPIGTRVLPVYVSIKNPYTKGVDAFWKEFGTGGSDAEGVAAAIAADYDGIIAKRPDRYYDNEAREFVDRGDEVTHYIVFDSEQIKSVFNRGSYDPADPNIMFSRGTTAEQEQEEQPRRPNIALRAIGYQGMDDAGSPEFSPGRLLYNMIGSAAGPFLSKASLKAASPELRQIMRKMKIDVAKAQETAAAVAKESMALTEDERQMVSDLIEKELQAGTVPPEHVIRLAATINTVMGKQTDELLRLGMLTRESAERWRGEYLPRFYESKLTATASDLWADAVRKAAGGGKPLKGIRGKHLRGRGMYETIPVTQLADYETMGWEVRDPDYQPGLTNDGMVQVWRDFTRQERDRMGEIRDAGFRFVMGYMQTQKDIALGRMFEALATNPELSSKNATEELSVQVPTGTAPGTEVKTYGKLAGRYVSPETLSQLSMIEEAQSEALMMYRKAMGLWKEGKTVLNPVAHANNVISNITMAHFAGVSYGRVDKYLAAIRDFATKSDDVLEAKDAGLFLGTMNEAELFNTLPEELKALARTQMSNLEKYTIDNNKLSAFNIMSFWLRKPMGWAYQAEDTFFRYLIYKDARGRGLSPDDAVDYAQKFIFTYDDLPKNARRIRDYGIPFFAYTYKAIPALLETALTHPERFAAPMAVIMAANAVAYAIAAGDDDDSWELKLKKYLTDPEYRKAAKAKEQLERELLPEWLKGNTSLQTDRTIRLGMDELTKLPMHLDISRMIPGGDMFDMHPNGGGLPWFQPLTPNHPLLSMYGAMFLNKDAFYGKDIVSRTDTAAEASRKRMDWMWKQMTPAIAYGNYHWERWMNALAQATGGEVQWAPEWATDKAIATGIGRDGLPVQPRLAAMQTFGIKARPYDLDKAEEIQRAMTNKDVREIEAEMRSMRRLMDLGAVSERTYDRKREAADEKKERLRDGLTVDGKPR